MRLPLLWIGVLVRADRGIAGRDDRASKRADDVVKYLLAGADVVMTTSALLRHGPEHLQTLSEGLSEWLRARGLLSPNDIRGKLSHAKVDNPEAYERANYIKVLQGFDVG